MLKYKKILMILSVSLINLIIFFLCYVYFPWVIMPVWSQCGTITLVENGTPFISKVEICNYINTIHKNNYALEVDMRIQQPQYYKLPKLNSGKIIVNIQMKDGMRGNSIDFSLNYEDALELYKKGILIYSVSDLKSNITIDGSVYMDQYVYIISGKEKTCYFEKAGETEWKKINDFSMLKVFKKKEIGYTPLYDEWKQNKWIVSKNRNYCS